jgi:hypothetical protein
MLPFDMSQDGGSTVDLSDDSLARMPSSGCSSLLEYVHSMPSVTGSKRAAVTTGITTAVLATNSSCGA